MRYARIYMYTEYPEMGVSSEAFGSLIRASRIKIYAQLGWIFQSFSKQMFTHLNLVKTCKASKSKKEQRKA